MYRPETGLSTTHGSTYSDIDTFEDLVAFRTLMLVDREAESCVHTMKLISQWDVFVSGT